MTPFRLLFLCTHNSARSILSEGVARAIAPDEIEAYSAGSNPRGSVHPEALAALTRAGLTTDGLTSKSWDVFAGKDAPTIDLVITVCDAAAQETCPYFSGAPLTVNWGVPDPSAAPETEQAARFDATLARLKARIDALTELKPHTLDRETLKREALAIAAADADPAGV